MNIWMYNHFTLNNVFVQKDTIITVGILEIVKTYLETVFGGGCAINLDSFGVFRTGQRKY